MPHTLLKLEKTHSSKIYKLNIIKNNHFILVFYMTKIYKMPGPDKSHVRINPFTHVVWTINGDCFQHKGTLAHDEHPHDNGTKQL